MLGDRFRTSMLALRKCEAAIRALLRIFREVTRTCRAMSFLYRVLFRVLRYVRDTFADKIGHYSFCVVAIIIVNEEVKKT